VRSPVDLAEEAPVSTRSRYTELPDADVVELAQTGREDAAEHLLYKYRNLVRSKVKSYFLVGADLLDEVERLLRAGAIKKIRVRLGNRTLKEIPVSLTAVGAVLIGFVAVLVTRFVIELEREG